MSVKNDSFWRYITTIAAAISMLALGSGLGVWRTQAVLAEEVKVVRKQQEVTAKDHDKLVVVETEQKRVKEDIREIKMGIQTIKQMLIANSLR